jgi:predicted dehydrogenase
MIRIGIMSGAKIVPRVVEGINEATNAQVSAIATRNIEKAQELAQKLNIPKFYGSYEELVNDSDLDLIYIPLINSLHFQGAKLALEAGKNVLLEKPFTVTYQETIELFELAKQKNVFLMEAQKELFLPVIQDVKRAINEGEIGKVQFVETKEARLRKKSVPWFFNLEDGGGLLIMGASYALSLFQYLFGVGMDEYNGLHLKKAIDKADKEFLIQMKKDDLLFSYYATTQWDLDSTFTITGEKGSISITDYWKTDRYTITKKGVKEIRQFPMNSEFFYEIEHVANLLMNHQKTGTIVTSEMTKETVKITDAFYQQWYSKRSR